ncbi:type I restriction enzyme, partial [Haemophilus influenzae]
LKKMITKLS